MGIVGGGFSGGVKVTFAICVQVKVTVTVTDGCGGGWLRVAVDDRFAGAPRHLTCRPPREGGIVV